MSRPSVLTAAILPLAVLSLATVVHAAGAAFAGDTFSGKVVAVSDGDTITVLRGDKPVKIRLHGVDCPEKDQPYGKAAKQLTSRLVFGKRVEVVVQARDRYGRTVAVVLVNAVDQGSRRSLNDELVKAGLAWWYRLYAPKNPTLARYEAAARQARRGLWADRAPVPPWDWRRGKRAVSGVGETAGSRQRCLSDRDCVLKLCCCQWRSLLKGAPEPAVCRRACRCRRVRMPRPAGVRCAAGSCALVFAGSGCYDDCLRRNSMQAVAWEAIEAQCRSRCASSGTSQPGALRCNVKSRVCHAPGCKDLARCRRCTATFETVEAARTAGFRLHGTCLSKARKGHIAATYARQVGRRVRLEGRAAEAKAGSVLVPGDSTEPIYVKGLRGWGKLLGKRVIVTGVLRREMMVPAPVHDSDGAIGQGAVGEQYVIEDARWSQMK